MSSNSGTDVISFVILAKAGIPLLALRGKLATLLSLGSYQQGVDMGAYVDRCLLPGEQVVAEARLHWALFLGPLLLFLFGLMIEPLRAFIIFARLCGPSTAS